MAFKKIIEELKDCGYKLTTNLYKFEDYGVPQARHRLIIVGIHEKLNLEYRVPTPTHKEKNLNCYDAITQPPITDNFYNHEYTKQSKSVVERLKYIKPGDNAWSDDIPEELRLNVKGARLSNIYKRLDPRKPAYTVTGSGGGGTHMYHWSENRALTNRESSTSNIPDDHVFYGSKGVFKASWYGYATKRNADYFEALLKTMAGSKYDSIESSH